MGSKFGVFLVRNDEWARDYLDRFATALESRPLLCSTSTFPEKAPFSPRSALCGGLGVCPGPKKCYEKVNDDRATYKEGVRAAYKCAEGPPGSKWNLAGDLPPTTIRRRANAKELRRAYDRAREELRTLDDDDDDEREARPRSKIN